MLEYDNSGLLMAAPLSASQTSENTEESSITNAIIEAATTAALGLMPGSAGAIIAFGYKEALKNKVASNSSEGTGKANIIVSKEQLIACGWNAVSITDEMLEDLNRVLKKYEINTPERISHFIAQCLYESGKGVYTFEQGSESYFSNKSYGSKYRGVGYVQMTWEYSYQAFATYLTLQDHPELKDYATYKSPDNNDAKTIAQQYDNVLKGAKALGINIDVYTDIVDNGYTYVSDNFAWESAGYFWDVKSLNTSIDNGATVDDISRKVNKWDTATFPLRKAFYDDIMQNDIFK